MSGVYYNEFDPKPAAWLRELIKDGLIPNGVVDERSITDVRADDLRGFTQCHFFAGVGGWSFALRLAGIPDDFPCWTGSCPCQPFSNAGKKKGMSDERDLWPVFERLIAECKPELVFGEQVASAIKCGWIDRVKSDLESENYAVASAILTASIVGAPHKRERLYWGAVLEKSEVVVYNMNITQPNKGNDNENMLKMQTDEAVDGIFAGEKIGGQAPILLQRMRSQEINGLPCPSQRGEESREQGAIQTESGSVKIVYPEIQAEVYMENDVATCEKKSDKIQIGIRFRQPCIADKRTSGKDDLRNDGDKAGTGSRNGQSGQEIPQHSLVGQDKSKSGLYLREYQDSMLGDELCDVNMGRTDAKNNNTSMDGERKCKTIAAMEYCHKWVKITTPGGYVIPKISASARTISDNACTGELQGYPTPDCSDRRSMKSKQTGTSNVAILTGWPKTPQASDGEGGVMQIQPGTTGKYKLRDWVHQVFLPGQTPPLSSAATLTSKADTVSAGFRLNPYFSAWLMGFPKSWTTCGIRASANLPKRVSRSAKKGQSKGITCS